MVRAIIGVIFTIFLVMIVGSIVLSEFPSLVPIFDEGKEVLVSLYNMSLVKYGLLTTVILIIGIVFLAGDKRR